MFTGSQIVPGVVKRENGRAGLGLETCGQTRLSLSWMEASCDDATSSGHSRRDAFRAALNQSDPCD